MRPGNWNGRQMKVEMIEVDEEGYILGRVVVYSGVEYPDRVFVENEPPSSFVIPKWDGEQWIEGKSYDDILKDSKRLKDSELNLACNQSILAGFTHIINGKTYWFSYDMEAQGNFRDAKEILTDGVVKELPWTVRKGGVNGEYSRIPITLEIMNELSLVIMQHKTDKISRYRDILMPLVNGATTVEEVEAVKW